MSTCSGANISEGFEGTLFPPEDWSQIITDNGPPVGAGILPTWCQAGTIALTLLFRLMVVLIRQQCVGFSSSG
jgi:hypothetical protein